MRPPSDARTRDPTALLKYARANQPRYLSTHLDRDRRGARAREPRARRRGARARREPRRGRARARERGDGARAAPRGLDRDRRARESRGARALERVERAGAEVAARAAELVLIGRESTESNGYSGC